MMRSFEALIKDINKNRNIANAVIENPDPKTYTVRIGKQKRAKHET